MPTVAIIGAYRFFFYSADADEPLHIHVQAGTAAAKFWLHPVRLCRSKGFNDHELREILKIVQKNILVFERKWHDYFGN
jgi:hypothetical protein